MDNVERTDLRRLIERRRVDVLNSIDKIREEIGRLTLEQEELWKIEDLLFKLGEEQNKKQN